MKEKKLKNRLLVLLLLCITCGQMYAQSSENFDSSGKVSSKMQVRKAQKAQKEHDRDIKFTMKYGVTSTQLQRIKEIRSSSRQKIRQIRNSKLSKTDKDAKIQEVRAVSQREMQTVLNPQQWNKYTYDRTKEKENNEKVREILINYKRMLKTAMKQPDIDRKKIRQSLERQCKQELQAYTSLEQANKIIKKRSLAKVSRFKEIKRFPWNEEKKKQLARYRIHHLQQIEKLKSSQLPHREVRKKKKAIDRNYYTKVKNCLGDVRYAQWKRFHATAFERRCKKQYQFTEKQWEQFKNIKNETAGTRLKIRQSKLPKDQKKMKVKEALAQEDENIREMLSVEQYSKWHQRRREKRKI